MHKYKLVLYSLSFCKYDVLIMHLLFFCLLFHVAISKLHFSIITCAFTVSMHCKCAAALPLPPDSSVCAQALPPAVVGCCCSRWMWWWLCQTQNPTGFITVEHKYDHASSANDTFWICSIHLLMNICLCMPWMQCNWIKAFAKYINYNCKKL